MAGKDSEREKIRGGMMKKKERWKNGRRKETERN